MTKEWEWMKAIKGYKDLDKKGQREVMLNTLPVIIERFEFFVKNEQITKEIAFDNLVQIIREFDLL